MANDFFNKGNVPISHGQGSSAQIRAEFAAIEVGFDKFPSLATFASYVTSSSLASTLTSYATTASLSAYATNASVASTLTSYATIASLSAYVTSVSLTSTLTGYATTSALSSGLSGKQNTLGFTPVQQGGGIGQSTNKIYIGWSGSGLKLTVDSTDAGDFIMESDLTPALALKANLTGAAFTGAISTTGDMTATGAVQGANVIATGTVQTVNTNVTGTINANSVTPPSGTLTVAGNITATSSQVNAKNTAKAFINFNGVTSAVNEQFGGLSITKLGTGIYRVNIPASIVNNANYTQLVQANSAAIIDVVSKTATEMQISLYDLTPLPKDSVNVNVSIYGL